MNTGKQAKPSRLGVAIALMLAAGIGMTACRDNAIKDLSPQDSQVFITNYDRTASFGQYRTFSMPDSVLIQSNDQSQTSATATEQRFLTNVANALISRGYTRVSGSQKPDLGVAVIRVNDTYTGVTSTPYSPYLYNSWYGGYGYGGLGGYGYSPYYPSYYSFYQVSDNYWSVQIVDLKNSPTAATGNTGTTTTDPNQGQNQLRVIYDAEIRGDGIFDANSVDQTVNAIFSQSPYLKVAQ